MSPALAQLNPINIDLWSANVNIAGQSPGEITNAFDGSLNTRWTTKTPQTPNQVFTLNFGKTEQLVEIQMVTTDGQQSTQDYPRRIRLELSENGQDWTTIAENAEGGTSDTTRFQFDQQAAQYARFTQLGEDEKYWWSIHELRAYTDQISHPIFEPKNRLDRTKWKTNANANDTQSALAIDNDVNSRWTTKTKQSPGQSFILDMGAMEEFNAIEIISRSGQLSELDYARGYVIQSSQDGTNWEDSIAEGNGDTSGITRIDFEPRNARYIRITQTGSDSFYWWSIHDLNIFFSSDVTHQNQAPIVQFVAPTPMEGARLKVEDELIIAVTADDTDGDIDNVTLYLNDQVVRTDYERPFTWSTSTDNGLRELNSGAYSLRASAADNLGAVTSVITSFLLEDDNNQPPVNNIPPTAEFLLPTSNSVFKVNEPFSVEISANDPDGNISNVRLFVNGQFVRQENLSPYEWNSQRDALLANLGIGQHLLRADITDNLGAITSTQTTISIIEDTPNNQTPTLSFVAPTPINGSTIAVHSDVNIAVEATDLDGTVDRVELYLNEKLVAYDNEAPYTWRATNYDVLKALSAGAYQLRAKVIDNDGYSTQITQEFSVRDPNITAGECIVSGELKRWHRIAITCNGPSADETAQHTFTDYRFNVTFSNGERSLTVPGHFAADGNAANSGATVGNQWRAYFSPPETGGWNYLVSFRTGQNIAIENDINIGTPVSEINGAGGSFQVSGSGEVTRDMRTRGLLLHYSGESRLRFEGSKNMFVQGGMDSPENIFGYNEFDNTVKFFNKGSCKGILHSFDPHAQDWNPGDPTWANGRGKNLVGLINYIASTGVNSVYIMMNTVNGDGCDAHPWSIYNEDGKVKSFDVSKLDQWEIVLSHMTQKGLLIHVMTQETENDRLLNFGELGLERKLYYRELISRFGHHPALQWNLGEENNNSTSQHRDYLSFIRDLDPYNHPIFLHTKPRKEDREAAYAPLLGNSIFDGPTIQTSNIDNSGDMYAEIRDWIRRSKEAGNTWVVTLTEASGGGAPFPFNDVSSDQRIYWMWASVMSGGGGFEWYLKGQNQGHAYDLAVENLREFDQHWQQSGHLIRFFRDIVQRDKQIDLGKLKVDNTAVLGNNSWVLSNPGNSYIVFLREGGSVQLSLAETGRYAALWYNPRTGQSLTMDSIDPRATLTPPADSSLDWALLLTLSEDTSGLHPDIVKVLDIPLDDITRTPSSNWSDSYSVGDRCYCETTFDHNIGPVIVDTELGEMTVHEVCETLGPGPGSEGRPKYNDVQCGNGPANDAGDEDFCPGRVDIQGSEQEKRLGCRQIGPTWNFR